MWILPSDYQKIDDLTDGTVKLTAWLSPAINDVCWDDFLRSTPQGQYQQSSVWAEFKAGEGWSHHRVVIARDDGIVGGFQILWKRKAAIRIGYVSKGPVAPAARPAFRALLVELLVSASRELGLSAVIAQSPDEADLDEDVGDETPGFVVGNPMKVIEATYLVDVRGDMATVRHRMNRKLRQCVRKAREQGVEVRSGSAADLPLFFKLMSATCRRQNSSPNPATLDSLRTLWDLFARTGSVELAFAGRDGIDVAGRMNLTFGDRVTQWKKGWDGSNYQWHPNELLADHALQWAHDRGYRVCDFSAISRPAAIHILQGGSIDAVARSRDMFNLRLGGYPQLLPRAKILLPNSLLRWSFRNIYVPFERWRERQRLAAINQSATVPAR